MIDWKRNCSFMYGLLDRDLSYIVSALSKFSQIEKAVIFGSRAIGNYI